MLQMNVPKYFWSYGVLIATHLINWLPSRVLDFKCPLEVLQDKVRDLSYLRVFGCTCYVHLPAIQRHKLNPRAVKWIFLGYSQTKKGYKCYEPESKKIYVSRDVLFAETIPYFKETSQQGILQELFPLLSTVPPIENPIDVQQVATDMATSSPVAVNIENFVNAPPADVTSSMECIQSNIQYRGEPLRRNPPQARQPPAKLQDYAGYIVRYPLHKSLTYQKLSPLHNFSHNNL